MTEVVGYFGPIVDELSTRAEETLYEAIAEGRPPPDSARRRFQRKGKRLSLIPIRLPGHNSCSIAVGPEWPLSVATPKGKRRIAAVLQRKFEGFGDRRVLSTGFIGRRVEQHKVRQRLREGARVFVFQGLGGLGNRNNF